MSTTAYGNSSTVDMKRLALQVDQIKDTNGAAINTTDLTNISPGNRYVAAGSTLTLTSASNGKTILLDTAAGSVVTLPAATGSGVKFKFVVKTLATSNSHKVQVANSNDTMQGIIFTEDGGTCTGWPATAGTSDTITLNRTTTGSVVKGEWIEVEDILANVWQVTGFTASSGTAATPFSAAV